MPKLSAPVPLTEDPELRAARERTYGGQASWATGPHICCDCAFFRRRVDRGTCTKAKRMMGLRRGRWFPCTALSCRYFMWKRRPGPKGRHQHGHK